MYIYHMYILYHYIHVYIIYINIARSAFLVEEGALVIHDWRKDMVRDNNNRAVERVDEESKDGAEGDGAGGGGESALAAPRSCAALREARGVRFFF